MAASERVLTVKRWMPVAAALLVPGSGHVLLGRPVRGLVFCCWMILFGIITWRLAPEHASRLGRLSGGVAVWVISVVEVARLAARRTDG